MKHGHAAGSRPSPEFTAWANMLARCKPGRPDASRYYERGTTVCDRWNPEAGGCFENFLADMGPRPSPLHSLDKDKVKIGNLLYSPENCRWATRSEQAVARRNSVFLTHDGQTHCLQHWAQLVGIKRSTLLRRLRLGWSAERVLTTKVDHQAGRFNSSKLITHGGKTQSIAEWSKETGINKSTIAWRLRHGWPPEKALVAVTLARV